jgi:molecular chaperone Hsp33
MSAQPRRPREVKPVPTSGGRWANSIEKIRKTEMSEFTLFSRAPADTPSDDSVLPFSVASLDLRGRIVRLGPALDDILGRHDYPAPISKLLGEAIVLTVLLGSSLKIDGRFILQTRGDGPVRMLVVDYKTPGKIRACAQFDAKRIGPTASAGELLGNGHLAMTIDQGGARNRYQGLVALNGGSLEDAAHEYFLRSEQIPTRVRLAVAEELTASADGSRHAWRAGGMLLQFLPKKSERMRGPDLAPGDAPEGAAVHIIAPDDAWVEGQARIDTLGDIELIDPALSSERLLYRLFHEHGVRVFRTSGVEAICSCSRESVELMLKSFPPEDRADMVENGVISVTCEFCNATYAFAPDQVETAPDRIN